MFEGIQPPEKQPKDRRQWETLPGGKVVKKKRSGNTGYTYLDKMSAPGVSRSEYRTQRHVNRLEEHLAEMDDEKMVEKANTEVKSLLSIPLEELTDEKIESIDLPKEVIADILIERGESVFVLHHPTLFKHCAYLKIAEKFIEESNAEKLVENLHRFPKKSLDYSVLEKLAKNDYLSDALEFSSVFDCDSAEIEKLKQAG